MMPADQLRARLHEVMRSDQSLAILRGVDADLRCPICGWWLSEAPYPPLQPGQYVCPIWTHDRVWTADEVRAATTRRDESVEERIARLKRRSRWVDSEGHFRPPAGWDPEKDA